MGLKKMQLFSGASKLRSTKELHLFVRLITQLLQIRNNFIRLIEYYLLILKVTKIVDSTSCFAKEP